MTKQVNDKNQIWFERNDNVVQVGFTKSFLDSLDQCWHILPANRERFREKAPLMVVETNDALISIMSPVTANYFMWTDKAQNFPDQLTEDDVILEMRIGEAVRNAPRPTTRPMDWDAPVPADFMEQVRAAQQRVVAQGPAPVGRRPSIFTVNTSTTEGSF